MAVEIVIPRLGWSMEEGVFVDWLKKPGEFVRRGEPLFELEGEKAIQEVEAIEEGYLHLPSTPPQPGSTLPVGAVLGYLLAEGESLPEVPANRSESREAAPTLPPAAGPAARRKARELNIPLEQVTGTGPGGRLQIEDIEQAAQKRTSVSSLSATSKPEAITAEKYSSPRARRVAQELKIDWTTLQGSGANGRVREVDVRNAASLRSQNSSSTAIGTRQLIPKRRRVIAERMSASHAQTAPVTLMSQADATNLVNLRGQLKQLPSLTVLPSYQDIIVKLVAELLPRHPQLVSRWEDSEIVIPGNDELHIGIAVDTPEGLLVPVLQNPKSTSLLELAEHSRQLVDRARSGQLSSTSLQGSVFTITNLGAFGVDFFTPVINLPEAAILGLGAIRSEPAVLDDGTIAVRQRLSLSLTFDHRRLDGAPAARFLQELTAAIATPSAWLISHS